MQVLIFVVGVLVGGFLLMCLSGYLVSRDKHKLTKVVEDVLKNEGNSTRDIESVKDRLHKAAEIGQRQLDLIQQTQAPSMNSLHSKYKNELVAEIKALEEDKRAILRGILKDGQDPKLTITTADGLKQVIKLSEYMLENGIPLDGPPPAPVPPQEGARLAKGGKFFVIEGGKGDGDCSLMEINYWEVKIFAKQIIRLQSGKEIIKEKVKEPGFWGCTKIVETTDYNVILLYIDMLGKEAIFKWHAPDRALIKQAYDDISKQIKDQTDAQHKEVVDAAVDAILLGGTDANSNK